MVVLGTCKNEENAINDKGAQVVTLYLFFRRSKAANSVVGVVEILTQSSFVVLVTCKNGEDQFRIEGGISPIISLWRFFETLKGS